jgi:hypothetical protein
MGELKEKIEPICRGCSGKRRSPLDDAERASVFEAGGEAWFVVLMA